MVGDRQSRAATARRLVLGIAAVAVCAAAALAGIASARGGGRPAVQAPTTHTGSFQSAALRTRLHFLIHLPAAYTANGRRYPVVYFLHGLPADPTSYESVSWLTNALDHTGEPAILVVPQATRRAGGDPEYYNWGPGHNWATAIALELTAYVDTHYRTIATREGRALVGVSAGGYGAASIDLQHPAQFSVIESWSGYFEPTDPTGTRRLELGSPQADAAASVHTLSASLSQQFRRFPTFFAFYVGRSDPTFVPENVALDQELRKAAVPHSFATYPGAHTQTLWQAHAVAWLGMALAHLTAPR